MPPVLRSTFATLSFHERERSMFRSQSRKRRFGFTLVEVLVTTVVIGVLAAVVLPALAKQTSAADPARLASDLNNIKMGVEMFAQNMRPDFPGDLEDLVNAPSSGAGDVGLDGASYSATTWKGPYLAAALPAIGAASTTDADLAWPAGATGEFSTDLKRCDIAVTGNCLSEVAATLESFVTLRLMGLTLTEVGDLNDLIDGPDESSKESAGMFRWASSTSPSPAHYFMIPFAP